MKINLIRLIFVLPEFSGSLRTNLTSELQIASKRFKRSCRLIDDCNRNL